MSRAGSPDKIPADYGMLDYYNHYKRTNQESNISRKVYSDVISQFNKKVMELVIEENFEYVMPRLLLSIDVRKDKRRITLREGKVHNTSPIDWKTTRSLWEKDSESKKNKVIVKYRNNHTGGYVFRLYCHKYRCRFVNSSAYKFKPSRNFKRMLGKRINHPNKDRYDCYLLYI